MGGSGCAGGGGKTWRLVSDITLAEDVGKLLISADDDGNAFALSELLLFVASKPIAGQTANNRCSVGFAANRGWGNDGNIELKPFAQRELNPPCIRGRTCAA